MNNKININQIYNDKRWPKVSCETLVDITKTCFRAVDKRLLDHGWEIDINFTNTAEVKEINNKYRQKDTDTNVLSFEYVDWSSKRKPVEFLGDILFSYDKIKEEASERNIKFDHHLKHLFVHSLLHLLGYDHQTDSEEKIMQELEFLILSEYNISPTY